VLRHPIQESQVRYGADVCLLTGDSGGLSAWEVAFRDEVASELLRCGDRDGTGRTESLEPIGGGGRRIVQK